MTGPDADARLRALEQQVATLTAEVARMRAGVGGSEPARDGASHPAPRAVASMPRVDRPVRPTLHARLAALDVESLVGRYGALFLGALTVLLGVGAFLGWAVQHVRLGPGTRVLLGALAAAGIAGLGVWLRARGTRRFGNVLLALALAVAHIVAWSAGPVLGVVPPFVALAAAAIASAALAALAWRDGDQALFVVGVGGALLAPFVTAREPGDPLALLAYGLVVLAGASAALRGRPWPWAVRLLTAAALLYAGVGLDATTSAWTAGLAGPHVWLRRDAPALFILLAAVAALLLGGHAHRSALTRRLIVVLAVPVAWRTTTILGGGARWDLVALALAGAAIVYVALRARAAQPHARTSAAMQPPLLLLAALFAAPLPPTNDAAVIAGAFALLAAIAAVEAGAARALTTPAESGEAGEAVEAAGDRDRATRGRGEPLWSVHVAVAAGALAVAVAILLRGMPVPVVAALGAIAVGAAWIARRGMVVAPLVPSAVALVAASLHAVDAIDARPPYVYTPFLTTASLAALCAVAAWWLVARIAAARLPARATRERAVVTALGPAAAFAWGWAELAHAVAPDVAAFLVIAYLATVGVGLILLGRRRRQPGGRRIGLGLALLAAVIAITEAYGFANVGLRVGSYLLVGGFLLAVAYWYRAAGDPAASRASAASDPT